MSDRHKIEGEVADVLAEARAKGDPEHRLYEIEESLLALARWLDEAFAEIRGDGRTDR